MSEYLILPIAVLLIAASVGLSWFCMRWLGDRLNFALRIMIAGFLPTVLIVLAIGIWHYVELAEYRTSGSLDGFMGPLLILIYGFPFFIITVVGGFIAAGSSGKRP